VIGAATGRCNHADDGSVGRWKITVSGSAGISLSHVLAKVKRRAEGTAGTMFVCEAARSSTIPSIRAALHVSRIGPVVSADCRPHLLGPACGQLVRLVQGVGGWVASVNRRASVLSRSGATSW